MSTLAVVVIFISGNVVGIVTGMFTVFLSGTRASWFVPFAAAFASFLALSATHLGGLW